MEKFRNLKLWQIIVIGIVIVIGINMLFSHSSKQAEQKLDNETSPSSAPFFSSKKSIPTDYVKVPETYLKQKSQVEEDFKQSGLSVNFVPVNFDNKSDISGKKISNGMCDQINEQSSLKYFSASEYDDYGNYAKKGTTLTVGYSDHDYTPKSTDTSKTPQSTSNVVAHQSPSSSAASSKVPSSNSSSKNDTFSKDIEILANDLSVKGVESIKEGDYESATITLSTSIISGSEIAAQNAISEINKEIVAMVSNDGTPNPILTYYVGATKVAENRSILEPSEVKFTSSLK